MNSMKGMAGAVRSSGHAGHAETEPEPEPEAEGGMQMGMRMYFHTGFMEYILFEKLEVKSNGGLAAACAVIFLLSIGYEGLKFLREKVVAQNNFRIAQVMVHGTPQEKEAQLKKSTRIFCTAHFLQTGLHAVQVLVSYVLMLIFMTYNIYLCLAVVLGATFGYFLVGWKRTQAVDTNEHCH